MPQMRSNLEIIHANKRRIEKEEKIARETITISIYKNANKCPACKEAYEYAKKKIENKENILFAITFENGMTHYHVPVSKVQFDKLDREFKFLT
jgi:hypothetical protein